MLTLYSYYRSSASYRVRIALSIKGLDYETSPIDLHRGGGDQKTAAYLALNPHGRVPALRLDDGRVLTQSMAILEYLDELRPNPPLLPRDLVTRAEARAVALMIVADIHPLLNLAPVGFLRDRLGGDAATIQGWYAHWISDGFGSIEAMIRPGRFCFGDTPSLADICLVPQVFNARRNGIDLSPFPRIVAVDAACTALPAFAAAHPSRQPDAK